MPAQIRRFFVSIVQVVLLTAALVGSIFASIRPDPNHYFAGSLLQVELLRDTPSPRIILVGGSNVSFGLDAERMERELGIPVINDGLHAGLGVVPLRELQEHIRPGDVIIISLEYHLFFSQDAMEGDTAFLSDWIEYVPGRIRYLSDAWTTAPALYATMLQRKVNRQVNTVLYGGSLNEVREVFVGTRYNANGDFIGHLQQASTPRRKITSEPYPVDRVQNEILIFLYQFHQAAREKGAEVYFAAPASRNINCKNTGETRMSKFFETFKQRTSIPLLTPFEEVCLPDKYFFDTAYHLNSEGRRLRTQRLIDNLIRISAQAK